MKLLSSHYNKLNWNTRTNLEMVAVGLGTPMACFALVLGVAALSNQIADPAASETPSSYQQPNLSLAR